MTFPLADPAFNNANIAALRVAEHRGDLAYLGEISASGDNESPTRPTPGALTVHEESERIRALINETRS